jgi:23S rRNA (uridine2552-2'-O)-methyltransferase
MTTKGGTKGGAEGGGGRNLPKRLKTAKKRTTSQQLWLQRQINDPYVARAKREGFRSRAAYKLIEIDEKHKILKTGDRVVDLGAAPGGWCQIAIFWTWSRYRAWILPRSISSIPMRRTN